MALAVGDFIQIVDSQTYLGRDVINVYWYRCTASVGALSDYLDNLLITFRDNVIIPVRAIQNGRLVHTTLAAKNFTNHVDIALLSTNQSGTRGTSVPEDSPSWVQAGFTLTRSSALTSTGAKRYAGLSEADLEGNNWASSVAPLNTISTALADALEPIPTITYVPVIVRVPPGPFPAITVYQNVVAAPFNHISTQRSRLP